MAGYNSKDSRRDTRSSRRKQSQAWHDARDHAAGSGYLNSRNRRKVSDSATGSILNDFMEAIGFKEKKKKKKKKGYW